MGDFRQLQVWKLAHGLTLDVYRATRNFPQEELYGITSQARRSAASVAANIAEGAGRNTDRELAHFARIALGSANELEYHLILARDLGLRNPGSARPGATLNGSTPDARRSHPHAAKLLIADS
jgi:four helix bundle protein